ncbi:ERF family protein [Acetobacter sp. TBRC 12305]|uniref:ERF family protein n=1 Tax=Acetobacter garciniae TaxID=2817435 RepID=A0A939HJ42_9PROT|nr:ERF family protein [Acetobacter garciniae]MBO1325378.1 ERF family protein [Acetobacter garciniae]MBX0345450.1 ERF family protein [Acetobacter garciniae]
MSEVITRPAAAIAKPQEPAGGDQLLALITQAASNPNCDVEKLRALLEMKKQVMEMDDRKAFNEAMALASGEIPQVFKAGIKDMKGHGSYKFAKWEDMDRLIRPVLLKHQLRLSFDTVRLDGGFIRVTGIITHASGQSQSASMELPIDNGPGRTEVQARGSTISYGKRYCAEMLLNIVRTDEDTDGAPRGPQPMSAITPEQKEELVRLLQETGANTEQFLAWARCRTLDEMEAKHFPKARQVLLAKLKGSSAS